MSSRRASTDAPPSNCRCRSLNGSTRIGPVCVVRLRRTRPGRKFESLGLVTFKPPGGLQFIVINNRVPPSKPNGLSVSKTARRSSLRRPAVRADAQPPFVVMPSIMALAGNSGDSQSATARLNTILLVVAGALVTPGTTGLISLSGVASTVNSTTIKSPLPSRPGPLKGRLALFNASSRKPVMLVS